MDNFRLVVVSDDEDLFFKAMEIAFKRWKNCVGYKIVQTQETWHAGDYCNECYRVFEKEKTNVVLSTLIFYWHDEVKDLQKFPFNMNWKTAAKFALDWLGQVEYPQQPDHDGDNHKGWRIFNGPWGHVNHEHAAIIGIRPEWAMYGK